MKLPIVLFTLLTIVVICATMTATHPIPMFITTLTFGTLVVAGILFIMQ